MSAQLPRTVLIVDDEPEIRSALTNYLSSEGFAVETAANGAEMTEILDNNQVDLMLLDLGLQNESGLDLLKDVVGKTDVAVVILTGKSDPIERVVGLELGADDYIVKPFLKRELLARINAVLRRSCPKTAPSNNSSETKPRHIHINNWLMDMQMHQVQTVDGTQIYLTGIEFDLLAALAKNVGKAMSRDQLSWSALNREWMPSDRSVDIHMHNLRRKLSLSDCKDEAIISVRNVGYMLVAKVNSK